MNINKIPEEIREDFRHKNVDFKVSKFEEYMLNDIFSYDEKVKEKLHRDVTKDFVEEINTYIEEKRNIRYSIIGETRSGKSLGGLKIGDIILDKRFKMNKQEGKDTSTLQEFNKDIFSIVCGNQVEYRQNLKDAKFGDFYLVDENYFNRSGLGANIEHQQLVDNNNMIAKLNISVIYITPEKFLSVGSTLGFSAYGRDSKNWLSKFLLYKFKNSFPHLIGYVILDIGDLYRKHGCYVYKQIGGCNNVKRVKYKDIDKRYIKHSTCFPKNYKKKDLSKKDSVCPFFDICKHGMCNYEKKKDSWIEKEMKGGLDERTFERYELALKLMLILGAYFDEGRGNIILRNVKSGKDLEKQAKPFLPKLTNTKFGIAETQEIFDIMKSNSNPITLCNNLELLELKDLQDKFFNIENGHMIKQIYEEQKKVLNSLEKITK